MIKLKNFSKAKVNNANDGYDSIIVKHKLSVFYRIVLAILAVTSVIIGIYIHEKNRVYTEYEIISTVSKPLVANTVCKNLNGNIITYSKDGIHCTDKEGNDLWNQTYEMANPLIDICKEVIAIGDYGGNVIYVMNTQGKLGEIDTKMPIRSLCVSETGLVAAVLEDSNITWIYLFGTDGEVLVHFKTTMGISGYPVDVTISNNGVMVGVSYLYMENGTMTTKVAFYNFGGVGQNEIDHLVSGYNYVDAIVPTLQFMNETTAFAVADNRLMFYQDSQIPTSIGETILTENVQSIYYSSDYVGLVFLNTDGKSKYRLDIYSSSGKIVHSQEFDMEYKEILFEKELFIIYNEIECSIYNLDGVEKYSGLFEKQVSLLIPSSKQTRYLYVTPEEIEIMELK